VSKSILREGGKNLQKQCSDEPVLASTHARVTNGGNLQCKYIIHIMTPSTSESLTVRIKEALDAASLIGAASVALPTLGAGNVFFIYNVCEIFGCDLLKIGLNKTKTPALKDSSAFDLFFKKICCYYKTVVFETTDVLNRWSGWQLKLIQKVNSCMLHLIGDVPGSKLLI